MYLASSLFRFTFLDKCLSVFKHSFQTFYEFLLMCNTCSSKSPLIPAVLSWTKSRLSQSVQWEEFQLISWGIQIRFSAENLPFAIALIHIPVPPGLLPVWYQRLFKLRQRGRGFTLTFHLHIKQKFRKDFKYTSLRRPKVIFDCDGRLVPL